MDYRTAPTFRADTLATVARYLEREWPHGASMGLPCASRIAHDSDNASRAIYAFPCSHYDGSRWVIVSDAYGNTTHADDPDTAFQKWCQKYGREVA